MWSLEQSSNMSELHSYYCQWIPAETLLGTMNNWQESGDPEQPNLSQFGMLQEAYAVELICNISKYYRK